MAVTIPFIISEGDTSDHVKIEANFEALLSAINSYYFPKSSSDTDAPVNSLYYSTTQSKLVYKDASGVVHALY